MGESLAYIRVSTVEQNEGRQLEAMKRYDINKYFTDKASGKDTNRPQLQALMDYAREGDTVYVESFSRLGRNTEDLLNLVKKMSAKGVKVISLKEGFDTGTPNGKLMFTFMAAISEFERDMILERQREGIALAKAQGKYKGRKAKQLPSNFDTLYQQYMTRKLTKTKLAELCNVSRPVLDRLIEQYELNNGNQRNA